MEEIMRLLQRIPDSKKEELIDALIRLQNALILQEQAPLCEETCAK